MRFLDEDLDRDPRREEMRERAHVSAAQRGVDLLTREHVEDRVHHVEAMQGADGHEANGPLTRTQHVAIHLPWQPSP